MRSVRFVVHEHQRLVVGVGYDDGRGGLATFEDHHFDALAKYRERTESQAFTLGHRSIRLCQHVGYLRVGSVSLEIYPKLSQDRPEQEWRGLLFHMLRVVSGVRLAPQDQAPLMHRAGDLFEMLLARFVELTRALVREGLARTYREVQENGTVFRGRLVVGAHLRENFVRKERLYVAYEVHDADNLPNRILHRALDRVLKTTGSPDLARQAEAALADFPDVSLAPIRDSEWSTLRFDRRTERYREALVLARMILRDERPDFRWGDQRVIALLFDMNALFESYLYEALRGLSGVSVRSQSPHRFWRPATGAAAWLKPDLLVSVHGSSAPIVLDAKWKIPKKGRPADDDLRQLFAYLHAFGSAEGALVYPRANGTQTDTSGDFLAGPHSGRVVHLDLFAGGAPNLVAFRESARDALGLPGAPTVAEPDPDTAVPSVPFAFASADPRPPVQEQWS